MLKIIFVNPDSTELTVEVDEDPNASILDIAREYNIDLEGACEGSLVCSTCHIILEQEWYNKLGQPSDAEADMLDLAFDLQPTSRLGCQIPITNQIDGIRIRVPGVTRNIRHRS